MPNATWQPQATSLLPGLSSDTLDGPSPSFSPCHGVLARGSTGACQQHSPLQRTPGKAWEKPEGKVCWRVRLNICMNTPNLCLCLPAMLEGQLVRLVCPITSEKPQKVKFHPRMCKLVWSCLPGAKFWEELFLLLHAVPFLIAMSCSYLSLMEAYSCLSYFYGILTTSHPPWFCCRKN